MSLADWLAINSRWIVAHEPNREEIADLVAVVDRDRKDAALPHLSPDWRLGISTALRRDVVRWLKKKHPTLCPPGLTA